MAIKFGTDGWRAIISDEFTFANVRIVASAIVRYLINHKLDKKELIIGYDSRFLSEHFAEEAGKVIAASHINCLITERDAPTPVVAFEVKDRGAAGAIMITASHNPSSYSGIKFIPEYAGPAFDEIAREIEDNILKNQGIEAKEQGKIERFNPQERYFKWLEGIVDKEIIRRAHLKVVCDPMYGSGRGYLDKLLQRFGCKTKEIHENRDVLFGGREPEPIEENLKDLCHEVIETSSDIGLATDGDADRFGVMDEKGKYLSANTILPMLFAYLVEERGYTGSVVRSVATTQMIDRIAKHHGIKVYETPVGFKYIAQLMLKGDVIIGGEESGGLSIKGHIPEKDGILANLLVTEMVAKKKKSLSIIVKELEDKFGTLVSIRVNLKLEEAFKKKLMDELEASPPVSIADIKVEKIIKMDGVKFVLRDDSCLLIRPSGTEPILRIYFEADSMKKIDTMAEAIEEIVNRIRK